MSNPLPRSRFYHRFGFKLLVVMTGIVAAVSIGTVLVIEGRISAAYRNLLSDQFAEEINRFRANERARTGVIRRGIEDASGAVRPIAAITSGDPERIYSDLGHELTPLLSRFSSEGEGPQPFFLFLNDAGILLDPPGGNTPPTEPFSRIIAGLEGDPTEGFSGYLVLPWPDRDHLYEVIVNPVEDEFADQFLGTVLFAIPALQNLGTDDDTPTIRNLFYIQDLLFPGLSRPELVEEIGRLLDRPHALAGTASPLLEIENSPYQLFFEKLDQRAGFPEVWQLSLYPLENLQSLIRQLNLLMLALLPISLLIGVLLSAYASRRLTGGILTLMEGTEEIRQGNFAVRIPEQGKDEIAALGHSFNRMAEDLALKEKFRSVLDLVTDSRVADRLLASEIEMGGELRRASILFCDIRGFTSLTDGMDPQLVVKVINQHMSALTDIAHQYHGVVDKFVGDEIMVLFGVPQEYGEDAVNAVRCALAMIAERKKLNEGSEYPIQIGIGVATGEVVAGCMGSAQRLNYSVLGDRVNLAARLCSKAQAGEVIIDEATAALMPEGGQLKPLEEVTLKGFKTPVTLYAISSLP